MNRKPVYNSDYPHRRVISAPNGLWFPQLWVERGPNDDRTVVDPWKTLTAPLSLEDAKQVAFSMHSTGNTQSV